MTGGRHEKSGESMARALLAILTELPARMVRARTPRPSTVSGRAKVGNTGEIPIVADET